MSELDLLKDELVRSDEEFRNLYAQHQAFESRLEELTHQSLQSQDDEMEEKEIKRRKLFLKDQMMAKIRAYQQEAAVAS